MSSSTDNVSLGSQSISASVSVPDLCDNTACMVNVRWSEPFVSCGGSVSHYVLSVTPPTSDCQSGSDSGSDFMTTATHYDLTVTANQTYILNISVNNSCGDMGQAAEYTIDVAGKDCGCVSSEHTSGTVITRTYENTLSVMTFTVAYNICKCG